MDNKKRKRLPPYVMLMLVSILMSFAIAGVYAVTKDTIEAAALQAQESARRAVMPEAAVMTELALADGAPLDYCYEAFDADGDFIGFVSQITVVGFGGEIEVTVGMDTTAAVTAIEVGGKDFSETSGLGAKTREPAFKDQFRGASGMLILKQNIDSVTGASISSGAVVSGVNQAVEYMKTLLPEDMIATDVEELPLTEEQIREVLPGVENVRWMGGGAGIDGWWQADNGYIVRATGFGEGPIAVTMGFDSDRTVSGLIIGDENFMETEGRGDGILADWYKQQFIGKRGVQAYGDGIDAISGATVTSDAALSAINACMGFDPAEPGREAPAESADEAGATAEPDPNPPVSAEPDAATEASVVAETPMPDAATEASVVAETPVPDAVTEATAAEAEGSGSLAPSLSIVWIERAETPMPDAVTEASVTEETSHEPDAVTAASVTE